MNKNIIGLVIAIIIIVVAVAGIVTYKNSNVDSNNNVGVENTENNVKEENNDIANAKTESTTNSKNKILVVYYSAQSHTKSVAEKIAKNLNADLFEIVPEDIYTSDDLDWTNNNSRVSKEHNEESLRDVKLKNTKVNNWEEYDTILIGYPIWWGIAAWPVDTFVKANNFDGKTVIPFCTSASSGLGQSGKLLEKEANGGIWKSGERFSSNASDKDIKSFTDSIK